MKKEPSVRRKATKLAANHSNKLSFDGVRTPLKVTRFHPARAFGIGFVLLLFVSIIFHGS